MCKQIVKDYFTTDAPAPAGSISVSECSEVRAQDDPYLEVLQQEEATDLHEEAH